MRGKDSSQYMACLSIFLMTSLDEQHLLVITNNIEEIFLSFFQTKKITFISIVQSANTASKFTMFQDTVLSIMKT